MAKKSEDSLACNLLLLKDSVKKAKEAADPEKDFDDYPIPKGKAIEGSVWIGNTIIGQPGWYAFADDLTGGSLPSLSNSFTSGAMVFQVDKRWMALTFGHGRWLLDQDKIIRDFGLKVAVNGLKDNELLNVNSKTLDRVPIQVQKHVGRESGLDVFSLDRAKDLVRSVAGRPAEKSLARHLVGGEGVRLSMPATANTLLAKCRKLLKLYRSTAYKKGPFAFIDHIQPVSDPSLLDELNSKVLKRLEDREVDELWLTPKDAEQWTGVVSVVYRGFRSRKEFESLELEDYYAELPKDFVFDRKAFNSHKIEVLREGEVEPSIRWRLYDCLGTEVVDGKKKCVYILTAGEWFKVAEGYAKEVNEAVLNLYDPTLVLPQYAHVDEGDYNEKIAKKLKWLCLDKHNVPMKPASIEPCDLFTPDRQFIHVKKWTSSKEASHHVSQAANPGELFFYEQKFRKALRVVVEKIDRKWLTYFPIEKPNPLDYEVVFAFIDKDKKGWPATLPFFTQLSLYNAEKRVSRIGYKTRLIRIDRK